MDQQQQPSINRTQTISSGALHHPEFAKTVIFTDDIIEYIRHYLLNEVIATDGKTWERRTDVNKKFIRPLMKEEYVYELVSHLRITITRFVPMSRLEKNEINNMIEFTANDLDTWFALNWKKAGISREMYFSDLISDSLINLLEAVMKMPQEGSIQDFFKDTYRGSESIGQPQEQRRNPIFPSFIKVGGS